MIMTYEQAIADASKHADRYEATHASDLSALQTMERAAKLQPSKREQRRMEAEARRRRNQHRREMQRAIAESMAVPAMYWMLSGLWLVSWFVPQPWATIIRAIVAVVKARLGE